MKREDGLFALAVFRPRSLESAELRPRLRPQRVELGRFQQRVARVHPARHQDALRHYEPISM